MGLYNFQKRGGKRGALPPSLRVTKNPMGGGGVYMSYEVLSWMFGFLWCQRVARCLRVECSQWGVHRYVHSVWMVTRLIFQDVGKFTARCSCVDLWGSLGCRHVGGWSVHVHKWGVHCYVHSCLNVHSEWVSESLGCRHVFISMFTWWMTGWCVRMSEC